MRMTIRTGTPGNMMRLVWREIPLTVRHILAGTMQQNVLFSRDTIPLPRDQLVEAAALGAYFVVSRSDIGLHVLAQRLHPEFLATGCVYVVIVNPQGRRSVPISTTPIPCSRSVSVRRNRTTYRLC